MALDHPRDSTIAVVGDGFGSLMVFTTARYVGFAPDAVTIYGTSAHPTSTYQQYAYNLGQTVLRSESESQFLPADWPTFAQLDAWAHKSLRPLTRSITRRYNPGVAEIMAEANVVQRELRWESNRYSCKVGWIQRETGPTPHFALYDEDARFLARAKHVVLALGHGPLSYPPALGLARTDERLRDRIVQAYDPKQYAPEGRYIVVGAGIASVNEWANALDVGGKVISLLRNPAPEEQDLNAPRCLFEALGIDAFQSVSFEERLEYLGKILKGTTPSRRSWQARINRGVEEGRFEQIIGEITDVQPGPAGLRAYVKAREGEDPGWLDVSGIVCGTGFNKSALTVPLLRRLVEHYDVPVEGGRLKLKNNCGVPGLDLAESRLCVMGIFANFVVPHGDTIAGLKYIARRFVADCARAERLTGRRFPSRVRLQLGLARESARAVRSVRATEQLA
jgi:hypothetical protein